MNKDKKKPEFDLNTIKRLLSYIWNGHKLRFFIIIICILIDTIIGVCSSLFIRNLIDKYIPELLKTNIWTDLIKYISTMGIIFLIGSITSYISQILLNGMSQSILKKIRQDLFEKMQSLPISYFDRNTHGDIMSHYTNDIDVVERFYSQSITQIFNTIITVISVLVVMFISNVVLTLIVLATVFCMYIALAMVSKNSGKYFKQNQENLAKINGYIEEIMNGQKVVKVFNHEDKIKEEFDILNERWFNTNYKANKYANILMPVMGNLTRLQYVIIAVIGGLLVLKNPNVYSLGLVAAFLQFSRALSMPVSRVAQQINLIILAFAGANRVFKLMDEDSEIDEGYITLVNVKEIDDKLVETSDKTNKWAWKCKTENDYIYVPLKGDVRFENVSFGYNERIVLHDINLFAKPGQKIAFVGATGAGKTTITNLINRFYDIQNGNITYDGINIKDIKKESLRRSLGLVLQDTNLFTGTIKENLMFGNENATDEEIIAACKLANADQFIKRLPEGYDTMLTNNGANLSQGQRQLLSIARAALINPPVMILDEATSSIDTRTEKIVQDGMDKLMEGRTVFVIAHRLSTIQNSKAIMVLDKGRIIERGSHEDLLEQKGVYYELYTGKFELD